MRARVLSSILAILTAAQAEGASRYVPTTAYPSIQSAVDGAVPGDTIYVAPGDYYESLLIGKSLTIERHPLLTGDVDIVGGTSGILVRVPTLNTQVTLRNVRLWYGSPTIYGYLSFYPPAPSTALPRLSLYNVYMGLPGTNGGVVGYLHLRADDLTVYGSQGRGISVTGTADLVDVGVFNSAGRGIAVWNSMYTPSGWYNRLLRGNIQSNGDAGLYVKNSVGVSFQVQDSYFAGNVGFGVHLDNADGSCVRNSTVESTQELAGEAGMGVYAYGSNVCIEDALIENNVHGVFVYTTEAGGPSEATLEDVTLRDNDIHLSRIGCDSGVLNLGGVTCWQGSNPQPCQLWSTQNCSQEPPAQP